MCRRNTDGAGCYKNCSPKCDGPKKAGDNKDGSCPKCDGPKKAGDNKDGSCPKCDGPKKNKDGRALNVMDRKRRAIIKIALNVMDRKRRAIIKMDRALNVMDRKRRAIIKMDRDSKFVPMFTSETRLKQRGKTFPSLCCLHYYLLFNNFAGETASVSKINISYKLRT